MGREESQHTDKIIGLTEQVLDAKNIHLFSTASLNH
jgi:hypothetical protein